jgi:CheY-like chemotaxis protein/HAMP domain-containing protein
LELSFRAKLKSIVVATTVTFVAVLAVNGWLGYRQGRDLADMESRMVPKLELAPRLEAQFQHLRQSMQEAVAAQDGPALDASIDLRNGFIATVSSAGPALTPAEAAQLRHAITTYHEAAYGVSRRLMRGEGGEALVDAVSAMQAQQKATEALIQRSARLDRRELAGAFSAVRGGISAGTRYGVTIGVAGLLAILLLSSWVGRGVLRTLGDISRGVARFATGHFEERIPITTHDELGAVAREANLMAASLERSVWLRASLSELSDELRFELDPVEVARRSLSYLSRRISAVAGALYLDDGRGGFSLAASYARGVDAAAGERRFVPGEGLPGQAALADELLVVNDVPAGYVRAASGLGEAPPNTLVLVPLFRSGKCVAVIELALFQAFRDEQRELLQSVREMLAIALDVARSRAKLRELLEISQKQTELLSAQETELMTSNTELREQQEELQRANDELEVQRQALSTQNAELEEAREDLTEKARELARVSSYKSQFLANMSHELRTPLNSMLLLSHLLAENETQRLSPKQVEYAKTIHSAGKDLLGLINQVLDLAKIESGHQEVELSDIHLADLVENARRLFAAAIQQKGLEFSVDVEPGLPERLTTDRQRVERILVNLLGNALKFTERGRIGLRVFRPSPAELASAKLDGAPALAFAVSDSGIGIPAAAQARIFAPFEQAEARTDRRYGGTGLGLAIARESAVLLGGNLCVESREREGSTFTCYLPERSALGKPDRAAAAPRLAAAALHEAPRVNTGSDQLLVVEDEPGFAELLSELVRAQHFKVAVATSGDEALRLAKALQPRGIILDVKLPDIDGWTVMERLRRDPETRAIPVHFISGVDAPERALSLGAVGYLTKPASPDELLGAIRLLTRLPSDTVPAVLIVEDDLSEGGSLVELLRGSGLAARHVTSAAAALDALAAETFGCIVLDLGLPDMDGLGLLETLKARGGGMPPVVVHTGRSLTREEVRRIEAYVEAVVLKDGTSSERLLDEVRLFVQYLGDTTPKTRPLADDGRGLPDVSLRGARILLADDDMRTVYAISALLRGKGADVLVAENGREALELLGVHPDVNAVLMDVMMPEMDGYEALKQLRADSRFKNLPAIALTARAMKGERERCLTAGASDYLAKPIDASRLLTTLKTWLEPSHHAQPGRS